MSGLTKETKLTLLYMLLAFAFSVAVRFVWSYQFAGYEPFIFNSEFMINTNDGYYWAEGARDILAGSHQDNDLSPITSAASLLTAFFAYILPFSFESIIFYMPLFLGSLIVIPVILIAKAYNDLEGGFIAALLSSIAWSYYNRTMIGYYDTDMLNIVLPMFLLWSIIWAIKTNENKYLLISALEILVYRWWYPQSYSLEFSFFGLILLYALIFNRKNLYNYKLLALMMFAMINIDELIRIPLVLSAFYMFKQERLQKYTYYILAAAIVLFFVSGGFNPIFAKIETYITASPSLAQGEGLDLHFYSVVQTIREAGHIPFELFAKRISGHVITFVFSVIGFIYLAFRHKIMIFALPMVALGFFAYAGGLRFTIYAVPALALGIAFLITQTASYMPSKRLGFLLSVILTLIVLYPNIEHIRDYKVPTVFNADEVKILDKLGNVAGREDYVVSWWDYGYPIRYYSDVKTLVDGGKHSGSVNFPVSFMLTNSQELCAKMARLDVEYTEKGFLSKKTSSNIERMMSDYGFKDTNDFLLSLQTDIKLPEKTRDVYFYLPYRMIDIYPTVAMFSNIDLMSGDIKNEGFFYASKNFRQDQNILDLGRGVSVDLQERKVRIGRSEVAIKRFIQTSYDKDMNFKKEVKLSRYGEGMSIIYMSFYDTFLVLDEKSYDSLYIRLMVLEDYDDSLFEQVLINPFAKVYKLKI